MAYFPDKLRVQVTTEEVILSIRSSEDRVDEYTFARDLFDGMVAAVDWTSEVWSGPEGLWVKVGASKVTLAVGLLSKREVHRIGLSEFRLMLAQYHSQAKGS